jgi:hypothetical protein
VHSVRGRGFTLPDEYLWEKTRNYFSSFRSTKNSMCPHFGHRAAKSG